MDLSPVHLLIIAAVFVLLFGAKRLPDGARSLGRSMRIFKSELRGMHEDDEQARQADHVPAPLPVAQPVQATPVEQTTVSSSVGQPPTAS